jgi:arsenate reductase
MAVTIYHNPNCSTSRKVLGWLRDKGIEPTIIEYLKTPPSAAELKRILKRMNARPQDILRRKGEAYETLGDADQLSADALIKKMLDEPVLIERPIVVSDKGAVLCRPPEKVWEVV